MPRQRPARTCIQRAGRARARKEHAGIVDALKKAREESGLSQRALAKAAGLGPTAVWGLEDGRHEPTIGVLARIATALGGELAVRYYPGTGPLIRDRFQTPMIDALAACLHPRWTASPEVWVTNPIKGVIDLLLDDRDGACVVCEAQSELRRVEQQVRWLHAKAEAVTSPRRPAPSSLLRLRDHVSTRGVAAQYGDYLRTAFPAAHQDAVAALVDGAPWPGPAIVWMTVTGGVATMRDEPPRGVSLGR